MKYNEDRLKSILNKRLHYSDFIGNMIFNIKYIEKDKYLTILIRDYIVIGIDLKDDVILEEIQIEGREHLIHNHHKDIKCRRLDRVMNIAHYILNYLNVNIVHLEDMSQFKYGHITIGGRELRILQGKKSIYDKYQYVNTVPNISESNVSEMNIRDFIQYKDDISVSEYVNTLLSSERYSDLRALIDIMYNSDNKHVYSLFNSNKYICTNIHLTHDCIITFTD